MQKIISLLIGIISINACSSFAYAQDSSKTSYIHRPVQVSFAYPLCSNGYEAYKYVNVVSFGMLLNVAAGLEGAEFSGLANIEMDYVQGAQFAGLVNYVGKRSSGAQFAGLANMVLQDADAVQFAGLLNYAGASSSGAQFAGLSNVSLGYTQAVQCAGLANYSKGDVHGWQIAGLANIAQNVNGVQVGFTNYAAAVNGMQLGVLNIADTVERGLLLGFMSIVRKGGYSALEVSASESAQPILSFLIGTKRLYSIFTGGVHFGTTAPSWIAGYGMGTRKEFNESSALHIEALGNVVFEPNVRIANNFNSLYQVRILYSHSIGDWFSVFGGPVFNMHISDVQNDGKPTSGISSYTFYNKTFEGTNYRAWVGFQAGLRW